MGPVLKLVVVSAIIIAVCFVPIGQVVPKPNLNAPLTTFPSGFYFGASTAAYQIEGGNSNDWSVTESARATKQASSAESRLGRLANWPAIKAAATDPSNYIAGQADDSFHRYPEDIALAKSLNLNSYRFSIEWSRVEPTPGQFDSAAIAYYQSLLKDLRSQNIEPFVTLWHTTLPIWVADQGGWTNPQTVSWFNDYVRTVVTALAPQVHYWITVNEIEVYTNNAYLSGHWPPDRRNPLAYVKVTNNLIAAHRRAFDTIKSIDPSAQIGLAKNNSIYAPDKNLLINVVTTKALSWWANDYILRRVADKEDFIGLNYYTYHVINFFRPRATGAAASDMGWEIYPEGLYDNLKSLSVYKKPIIITENGIADATDSQRAAYIQQSLVAVQAAMNQGVDVRGYLHWSLLDNFEWAEGYWPKFGLVAVDRQTLARTVRPSAKVYANLIKQLTP